MGFSLSKKGSNRKADRLERLKVASAVRAQSMGTVSTPATRVVSDAAASVESARGEGGLGGEGGGVRETRGA